MAEPDCPKLANTWHQAILNSVQLVIKRLANIFSLIKKGVLSLHQINKNQMAVPINPTYTVQEEYLLWGESGTAEILNHQWVRYLISKISTYWYSPPDDLKTFLKNL